MWNGLGLSLHQKFQVWNIYLAPILSYVEQVRRLSVEQNAEVVQALATFVGGVFGWVVPEALVFFQTLVLQLLHSHCSQVAHGVQPCFSWKSIC